MRPARFVGTAHFYFQYPLEAEISEENGAGYIEYDGCRVDFGRSFQHFAGEDIEIKKKSEADRHFEAWYRNNTLIL